MDERKLIYTNQKETQEIKKKVIWRENVVL
jgi:hypothetical protein